ncbi:DUF2651 family protein [Halobacillus amylolyticus]|uniref:YbeF family protein n=1 Tax=Halobacillus amylolyticus TaxID=2932259 RepID=A0ABY4HEY6_9BACI|nr:DUF2651 family protein [Halobacillus amylolyticus]UOR12858.1 YbeF family protein [Halobacillus amylolyticus]
MNIYLVQLVIFVLPVVSLILGAVGYFIFKNIYITPVIVAIAAIISTFVVFNSSFWIWVVIYTMLSLVSGFIVKLLSSKRRLKHS